MHRLLEIGPELLKSGARSIVSGWSRFNLEKWLIAAQVALSLILVFGAGLFVRSFVTLATIDPGFTRDGVFLLGYGPSENSRATIEDAISHSPTTTNTMNAQFSIAY